MSTVTNDELRFVPYVPAGFEGPTVDVVDALKRAKAVLVEEDRWVKRSWFLNEHPEVDPQDPFCNSWKVCAEGAVLVVTIGVVNEGLVNSGSASSCPWHGYDLPPRSYDNLVDSAQQAIYEEAKLFLAEAGMRITGVDVSSAWEVNDEIFETRDEVLAWFDATITAAETGRPEPTPEPV